MWSVNKNVSGFTKMVIWLSVFQCEKRTLFVLFNLNHLSSERGLTFGFGTCLSEFKTK